MGVGRSSNTVDTNETTVTPVCVFMLSGHMVVALYLKFKKKAKTRSELELVQRLRTSMKQTLDKKQARLGGSGAITCLGGSINNVHLVQFLLNP